MGQETASARLGLSAEPELPGVEFEHHLVGVRAGAKDGGIEGGLVFGRALGLARARPAGRVVLGRRGRILQSHLLPITRHFQILSARDACPGRPRNEAATDLTYRYAYPES